MDDGVDMRDEPLRVRKIWLEKLLKRISPGILLNEHVAGAVGDLFRHACNLGLEGIVSKHRDRAPTALENRRTGSR
jgi:bifunctional non-homologous end joining protein LigD